MTGWESMWQAGVPPGAAFDAAAVEPALQQLIDSGDLPTGPALVPGCGRGYAVLALAEGGARSALGVDIAPTAVREAEAFLNGAPGAEVACADFFGELPQARSGQFALGYDCTFLCAIPAAMRPAWASAWRQLLKPGGELVTLLFPLRPASEPDPALPGQVGAGPPFAVSLELARQLLELEGFELISAEKVSQQMLARPQRGGGEIIARWRRSPDS